MRFQLLHVEVAALHDLFEGNHCVTVTEDLAVHREILCPFSILDIWGLRSCVTGWFLFLGLLGEVALLPWALLPERVRRAAGGCLGHKEGQRGARRESSRRRQRGSSKPPTCGEKHPPQGMERSLCCPWAHATAGMIMALGLVIPLPHAPLMCKCSEGWPNTLRENTSEEIETSLN